jgi:sec-independent protein translocase protein TatB
MLSIPHLIVIFLVALVVLGPEKLPQVARVLGKTMADFRRVTNDFRMQVEDEMRDLERQAREREIATALSATTVATAATTPPPPAEFTTTPAIQPVEPHAEAAPTEKPSDGEPHPA